MQFKASPSDGNGGGNYLKLKPGETVQVALRGNPFEFHVQWIEGKGIPCTPGALNAKFRFRMNAVMQENGALVSKIWEQGPAIYNMLKELHQEYDLTKTMLKIKRTGSGMDTEYSVLPLKKELTPDQISKIDAVTLHDLAPKVQTPPTDNGNKNFPSSFDGDEEIPF